VISFDTNILVYYFNRDAHKHKAARTFLSDLQARDDVVVCELVLLETYILLRNPAVFSKPVSGQVAAASLQSFRQHPHWRLVDYPGTRAIADRLWKAAAKPRIARRRIFDIRLALTLKHHGVTQFATANVRDFKDAGFDRLWDPL
jgi:toxin-antitoxin system PIN domain toxin